MDDRHSFDEGAKTKPRHIEDREKIINGPSPYTELLVLAGIDIHEKDVRERVIRLLRYSYERQTIRDQRSVRNSGIILAIFTATVGAVVSITLTQMWGIIIPWLHHGLGIR